MIEKIHPDLLGPLRMKLCAKWQQNFISVLVVAGAIHELPLHGSEEKTSLVPAMPG
jgi:hypothetical protein